MTSPQAVTVGAGPLAPADVVAVARGGAQVQLAAEAVARVRAGRKII